LLPRPAEPAAISIAELERVAALGWRAPEEHAMGEWLLRAAGGFTGRANSALAIGDPGLPLPEAIDEVCRWYLARDLTPMVAVPVPLGGPGVGAGRGQAGSGDLGKTELGGEDPGGEDPVGEDLGSGEVDGYLARCGWGIRANAATVMTAAPAAVARVAVPEGLRVGVAPEPDRAWLDCYHYRGQTLPPVALTLLLSAPWQAFASARAGGRTIAVGRVAVGAGWAGITAVEVDREHRRQGLASAITRALADAAVSQSATGLYLQVEDGNHAARNLYRRVGFTEHHGYRYRVAPATS
jgi:ribosomal protein S18 acetylase RimI-like enzyme